jgi:hypothetical protein
MQDEKVEGLPVMGYQPQASDNISRVNEAKSLEERVLRHLDRLLGTTKMTTPGDTEPAYDARWLAIARTHIELGFMAANRAVFQPQRVELPEDYLPEAEPFALSSDRPEDKSHRPDLPKAGGFDAGN